LNAADPPGQFGAGPFLIHALSSDGMLHSLHLSNGNDHQPPMKFLPPNANASGLIVVGNLAYVATQNGCGGVPDGVWVLDLTSGKVSSWKAALAGSAGVAFGVDGTIYATTKGVGQLADSLVALDPQTLAVIDWYSPGSTFTSSPVVFEFGGRVLVAASTADGRLHLLDAMKPGGEDHKTPLGTALVKSKGQLWPGALASWQDRNKTRWILVPDILPAGTSASMTSATSVGAWKLVEQAGKLSLEPGWTSRGMVSPLPPTIINDVVFVTSGGDLRWDQGPRPSPRVLSSSRAVLYALDGITGEELWNSGSLITSSPRGEALSGGVGQIYVGTNTGVLFAFGFPMEH
jgi:outer membrane protein assembly factor BamB